jgi:MYXO-CTERM domain-containing protein
MPRWQVPSVSIWQLAKSNSRDVLEGSTRSLWLFSWGELSQRHIQFISPVTVLEPMRPRVGFILLVVSCSEPMTSLAPQRTGLTLQSADEALTRLAFARESELRDLELQLISTQETLTGRTLRFRQQLGGVPIFQSSVVAQISKEKSPLVSVNTLGLQDVHGLVMPSTELTAAQAVSIGLHSLSLQRPWRVAPTVERGVMPRIETLAKGEGAKIVGPAVAFRVVGEAQNAAFELMLDAETGVVLQHRDLRHRVDGRGLVFSPNPIASTGNLTLVDDEDKNSQALDEARISVTLPRLDGSGFLRGSAANVRAVTESQRAQSATNDYAYQREDDRFEEVTAYFHLDRAQERLQNLGFRNVNNRPMLAVVNDGTMDNSFYSEASHELHFGAGGVDDAEDGDIVMHEYGHAIQDNQVPGFGVRDEGAMGEGFGDYLASSFMAALGPQLSDPACVGDWDSSIYSTTNPKCLRRVDGLKHYPEFATSEVHDDGEMWSAALWEIRGFLGADTTDTVLIQSHFALSDTETFASACHAFLAANQALFNGAQQTRIQRTFIKYGLVRTLSAPFVGPIVRTIAFELFSADGGAYGDSVDEEKRVTIAGAQGLSVHFSKVDLETKRACFQGSCDNVYLSNGQGDLFEVVTAKDAGFTSVAVLGDTLVVRLVTDSSVRGLGYRIDRVNVHGVVDGGVAQESDAGGSIDSGVVSVMDAGEFEDAGPGIEAPDASIFVDAGPVDLGMPFADAGLGAQLDGGGCGCSTGSESWALVAVGLLMRARRAKKS